MTPIGQIERKTQDRVVALLQGRLGYADLGNPAQQAKAATKRPDVVLYVNGIALAVLESSAPRCRWPKAFARTWTTRRRSSSSRFSRPCSG